MNDWVPSRSTSSVTGPRKSHFDASFAPRFEILSFAEIAPSICPIVISEAG
jgi:hypothetical protein